MSDGPVILVDAMSALYRSFYALPAMSTSNGTPSSGLFGVATLLLMLEREHAPSGFALAFDLPGPGHRQASFPGYKAHRAKAPLALIDQIRGLWSMAKALGIPTHASAGWEADDVLASLAARIEAPRIVVSGDTDLLQLVRPGVQGMLLGQHGRKNLLLDEVAFRSRYGYPPARMATFKAMVGDPSDGIPGVPGLGASSAKSLCSSFGDAAGILAALDGGLIGNRRLPPVLTANRELLVRWEALGQLEADLPLDPPLTAPIDRAGFRAFAEEWEMHRLSARLADG